MKKANDGKDFFISKEERNGLCGWNDSAARKVWQNEMDPPEEWLEAHKWVQAKEEGEDVQIVKIVPGSSGSNQYVPRKSFQHLQTSHRVYYELLSLSLSLSLLLLLLSLSLSLSLLLLLLLFTLLLLLLLLLMLLLLLLLMLLPLFCYYCFIHLDQGEACSE
jgi:hypothetical protein